VSVSVVIPHYFAVRELNLPQIVEAWRTGTRTPDEIVIWNNDAPLTVSLPGVRVIQSPWNLGCKARFLGALCATGDWILFQDNDLMARPGTLARLMAYALEHPGAIVSLDGHRDVSGVDGRKWYRVKGCGASEIQAIDITLGRMELMRRDVLMRLLAEFPFRDDSVMDDLIFSACAKRLGVPCLVVPHGKHETCVNLPTGGVGLSITHKDEYQSERNRVMAPWSPYPPTQAAVPCGG